VTPVDVRHGVVGALSGGADCHSRGDRCVRIVEHRSGIEVPGPVSLEEHVLESQAMTPELSASG
jgi:hypothetical protein